MPTLPAALIIEAKRLEKLQAKRRKIRKELRDIETEIKLVRKHIKGLSATSIGPDDQLPARWKGKVE